MMEESVWNIAMREWQQRAAGTAAIPPIEWMAAQALVLLEARVEELREGVDELAKRIDKLEQADG